MSDRPLRIVQTCLHLRHKLMYVDIDHMRPGEVDVTSSTRNYWCQRTQESRGPDRQSADPFSCSASRACYRGAGLSATTDAHRPAASDGAAEATLP